MARLARNVQNNFNNQPSGLHMKSIVQNTIDSYQRCSSWRWGQSYWSIQPTWVYCSCDEEFFYICHFFSRTSLFLQDNSPKVSSSLLEKKACVIWFGNMKGSNVNGSLCKKFTLRNPTSSHTYVGFPWLYSHWIHSHLKIAIRVCTRP